MKKLTALTAMLLAVPSIACSADSSSDDSTDDVSVEVPSTVETQATTVRWFCVSTRVYYSSSTTCAANCAGSGCTREALCTRSGCRGL